MEKFQKINPFIFHVLQGVDEEIEKGLEGITFNIAGSNHLMPGARVTGKDFYSSSSFLGSSHIKVLWIFSKPLMVFNLHVFTHS